MPRRKKIPAYSLHKASGQARVRIDGTDVYPGPYGSPESREKYARFIAERHNVEAPSFTAADGRQYPDLLIAELLVQYMDFCEGYYVQNGKPTKEVKSTTYALRPVRAMYASLPARDMGPKNLKAVQRYMIETEDLCRKLINERVGRIKRMFKWAVSEELVPPFVYEALSTVAGLRYGRTDARESEPVKPVPDAHVEMVLPFLPPQVVAMIRLQRLTGMRPEDVVAIRLIDIDMSEGVWVYEPAEHKNAWRGHRRMIPIGPQAQDIIRPYLDRPIDAYLFSPREVMEWRREQQRSQPSNRKTKVYPSERRRLERQRQERRRTNSKQRTPGDRYDSLSYYRAIRYGIKKGRRAGVDVPTWSPNQLRHSRGTEVRKQFGVEAAQVILGHAKADVTQIYAERNLDLAIQVAKKNRIMSNRRMPMGHDPTQLPKDPEVLKRIMVRLDETIEFYDRIRQRQQALLKQARRAVDDPVSEARLLERLRIEAQVQSASESVRGVPPMDVFEPYLDHENMSAAIKRFREAKNRTPTIRELGDGQPRHAALLHSYEELVEAYRDVVECHRDLQRRVVAALKRMTGETPRQTGIRLRNARINEIARQMADTSPQLSKDCTGG